MFFVEITTQILDLLTQISQWIILIVEHECSQNERGHIWNSHGSYGSH